MRVYIDRAEVIKDYLEKIGDAPMAKSSPVYTEDSTVVIEKRNIFPGNKKGVDLRIGPIEKEDTHTFFFDSSPLITKVNINQNIVAPGESMHISLDVNNTSGVAVKQLRVALVQTETTASMDRTGKRIYNRRPLVINPIFYGKGFPIRRQKHAGKIKYKIPEDVLPSDTDNSSTFAREYELEFILNVEGFHHRVRMTFPLRVNSSRERS